MLQTEFLRSLNCNYERILLDRNPEEKRFQYCMLSRGGMKGLLSCSLRYINGSAYLYYDITSKQNVAQIYGKRSMTRQWVKDFVWSMQQVRDELARFLLDEQNVLWYPQQVYQDLESNIFSFLYVPYYAGDNGFGMLLEFMIEHIDYEDERLVECVYKMYEQYEKGGQDYLYSQMMQDIEMLDAVPEVISEEAIISEQVANTVETEGAEELVEDRPLKLLLKGEPANTAEKNHMGIRSIFKNRRKKERKARDDYREAMQPAMAGYAVAEESTYEEEEWGKTVYIEAKAVDKECVYCLYTPEGRILAKLEKEALTIGKIKEEADVVLEDMSVSRMHARIFKEGNEVYLEDLNSTNGTYKNGLQLQPYEKRSLETEDEIMVGKVPLIFREMYFS